MSFRFMDLVFTDTLYSLFQYLKRYRDVTGTEYTVLTSTLGLT